MAKVEWHGKILFPKANHNSQEADMIQRVEEGSGTTLLHGGGGEKTESRPSGQD